MESQSSRCAACAHLTFVIRLPLNQAMEKKHTGKKSGDQVWRFVGSDCHKPGWFCGGLSVLRSPGRRGHDSFLSHHCLVESHNTIRRVQLSWNCLRPSTTGCVAK